MRDEITGQRLLGIAPATWDDAAYFRTISVADQVAVPDATIVDRRFPDLSAWDTSTYNGACFADTGIVRACVQFDEGFEHAMEQNEANGISTDVLYVFPYFGRSTQPQDITERACQAAIDRKIPILMFDAELDSKQVPPSGPAMRNDQTRSCIGIIEQAKKKPRIYSAPWWWVPNHLNTPEFFERGVDFHLANYGANDGTMQALRTNAQGFAWPYNVAHQFWSLADYCGRVPRDMSYLWSDGLPEDDMTPEQVNALIDTALTDATRSGRLVGGTDWLVLFAQTIGVEPETFTDDVMLARIRAALAAGQVDPTKVAALALAVEAFSAALRGIASVT